MSFILSSEAFSQAKDRENPKANEDRFLVLPQRVYAVIDGITDKSGRRFGGLTGGQIAGRIVEDTIRFACDRYEPNSIEADWLLERIDEKFADTFAQLGLRGDVDPLSTAPFAAQMVLALIGRERVRFIIVGDCGLRLNGDEVIQPTFSLDVICATIRKVVWKHLTGKGADQQTANDLARSYTVAGLESVFPKSVGLVTAEELGRIREDVSTRVSSALPDIPRTDIDQAMAGGVAAQHRYANKIHPLGFATVNGQPVPSSMIVSIDRNLSEIETIELFSDGYFGFPEGTSIADWEDWIALVEAEDPAKLARFASTKGSVGQCLTDDRTILIIRCQDAHRVSKAQ